MRNYTLHKSYPLKPIAEAKHRDDAQCPDGGWKGLTTEQRKRLGMMSRKAAEVQGVSMKKADFDAWRHEVSIRACGCRITEATQSNWADLKAAFEDLGGHPEKAFKTQMREGDNKRRVAMFKLEGELKAKGLATGYAAAICKVQFKCELGDASAKQIWCLFYTVKNRKN